MFKNKAGKEAELCKDWFFDIYKTKIYGYIISASINVVNLVMKYLMIFLVTNIRYDTKSALMSNIKTGVFIA